MKLEQQQWGLKERKHKKPHQLHGSGPSVLQVGTIAPDLYLKVFQ